MKERLCLLAWGVLLTACGPVGRPSGLPAPEYEVPQLDPWPPASSATAKAGAPAVEPAPVGVEPAPEEPAGPPQNAGGSGATLPPGTP